MTMITTMNSIQNMMNTMTIEQNIYDLENLSENVYQIPILIEEFEEEKKKTFQNGHMHIAIKLFDSSMSRYFFLINSARKPNSSQQHLKIKME